METLSQFHLENLIERLRQKNRTHIHERAFAASIYMALRLEALHRNKIIPILSKLGTFCDKTAHRYTSFFLNGDEEVLSEETRGKYDRNDIFNYSPDLKEELKKYTIERVSQKEAIFKIDILKSFAKSILTLYYPNLGPNTFITEKGLYGSISSWGFFFGEKIKQDLILMDMKELM